MAIVECAISGLKFKVNFGPLYLDKTVGYYHPIFALDYKKLYSLYAKHAQGQLTTTDSYLLFLAFLHSTDKIKWNHPASCNPQAPRTIKLIENNILQLIRVIEQTDMIVHPRFKQPSFVVEEDNSKLGQIHYWIKAWEDNIANFKAGYASQKLHEDIVKLENKLAYLLHSGYDPETFTTVISEWAAKAADFPAHKKEAWCKIIRACYNPKKMFNTPLVHIKEVKEYCESNIEQGSIYSFSLMETLRTGMKKHTEYLGITNLPEHGYTLMSSTATKEDIAIAAIVAAAPEEEPIRSEYSSTVEYLKAKLRYKVNQTQVAKTKDTSSFNIAGKDIKL